MNLSPVHCRTVFSDLKRGSKNLKKKNRADETKKSAEIFGGHFLFTD